MSENHFRSHFYPFHIDTQLKFFFGKFLTKWPMSAILDVQISLSITFLAISDRYATLIFLEIFVKLAAVGHFGCPKFTFDHISGHFRSIGHFGFPKFTFDRNSGHFRSIQNYFFPAAILDDVRNSLSMAFLPISDPHGTSFFLNF